MSPCLHRYFEAKRKAAERKAKKEEWAAEMASRGLTTAQSYLFETEDTAHGHYDRKAKKDKAAAAFGWDAFNTDTLHKVRVVTRVHMGACIYLHVRAPTSSALRHAFEALDFSFFFLLFFPIFAIYNSLSSYLFIFLSSLFTVMPSSPLNSFPLYFPCRRSFLYPYPTTSKPSSLAIRLPQAYEKRLASLPKTQSAADAARSTDAMGYGTLAAMSSSSSGGSAGGGPQDSAAALDRMAKELAAKADRNKKFSRRRAELDGADVDHINSRNAHFNKKIKRAYDKYTIEIKQDLERGTAL
jgi:hypothetical protein